MPAPLSSVTASRLEKAVVDNGFDRELPMAGEWLGFASTQSTLRIWLGMTQAGVALMALSQQNLTIALGELGGPCAELLPVGAVGARVVSDIPTLNRLSRWALIR